MIHKASLGCVFLVAVTLLPQAIHAQDSSPSSGSPAEQSESSDSLARNRYSRRQQATLEMWRHREASREKVQEAAKHPDPEVSGRAKWILRQWRRGSQPDTPPEIHRLLQKSNGPAAVERLMEAGQFTAAVVAVEEAAGAAERLAIQQAISSALRQRFPVYVHHGVQRDSLDDLLKLIDLLADSKELAVCRVQLMREMGIDLNPQMLLPASAESWSLAERRRATALVLMVLNDIDGAIEVSRADGGDEDLLRQCQMIGARWADAAQDSLQRAEEAEEGSYELTRAWCKVMIAADRANDRALFQRAVDKLTSDPVGDSGLGDELRWKCLASHGEVDAALRILDQVSPHASASLSIDASRTGRAFDVLGYPLERLDSDYEQWVDAAIDSQRTSTSRELDPEFRSVLTLIQCLTAVGRDDAAWLIAERLCRSDAKVGDLWLREYVLSTLTMTKRTDWVVKLALDHGETKVSLESMNTIARTLPDGDLDTLEVIMRSLTILKRDLPALKRLQMAYSLMDGEVPDDFDPEVDFRRLHQYVTTPRQTRRGTTISQRGIMATLGLVRMFARHGESDLASDCLQKLAQEGKPDALFFLAEQELDGGRAATALALFESVREIVAKTPRRTKTVRSTDNAAMAVKSLIGMRSVAMRRGDDQLAAELTREIRLALCSPSASLRKEIADYLGERGDQALAREVYGPLFPMAVLGNPEAQGIYDVARGFSLLARDENPAEAARWFDLAIGGTLDSMNFRPGAYITLPLYVRRWAIEAAIGEKNEPQVRHHLDRILRLDPLDIDFAERLLPEMRQAGMDALADEALNKIIDHGLAYSDAFPFDAMTNNNLAWVAAMNGSRLDDALKLSQRAVYAEPESAIYRDTLAEVLFLLGRKQEALQVERGCLLDDPGQWHLHEQIKKYEDALKADAS